MSIDPDPCATCGRDAGLGYGGDLCGNGHALCWGCRYRACGECEVEAA